MNEREENSMWNAYDYQKMTEQIDFLLGKYAFIQSREIGKSVLKKPIIELQIGSGNMQTHFNASFHGNEWITSALLMKCLTNFAKQIESDPDQSILDDINISIVPMVNPDGVNLVLHGLQAAEEYAESVLESNQGEKSFHNWKANIRGVDLNKQFPAKWQEELAARPKRPSFRDYPGKAPFTELEVIAIKQLIEQADFKRIHAFHTQGKEIYWGFNQQEPAYAKDIVNQYSLVTGYKAVQHINNYSGLKDWFIKQFRRPGFTIEFGEGINPLPFNQFDQMYEAAWAIFITNIAIK